MGLTDDAVNDAVVVVVILSAAVVVDSFAFDRFSDHNQPDSVLTVVAIFYVNLNYHHCLEIVAVVVWNIEPVSWSSAVAETTIHCTW